MDLRAVGHLGDPLRHVRRPASRRRPEPPRRRSPRSPRSRRHHRSVAARPTHVAVIQGQNAGATANLAEAPILIGRGNDAAIRLDDDYVSTRHARIVASGDQWYVEDLGSTNGTYLGTQRITQPTTIGLGAQVRIGKTILELRK